MRKTKKLTLSATLVALGVLFMTLAAFVPALDLSCAVLASLLVAFAYMELGSPYTWLIWLSTSLLAFIFFQASFVWLTYLLVYGIFPIIKGYIERLPRPLWLPIKLVFLNAMMAIMLLFSEVLVGQPFFGDISGLPFDPRIVCVALWVLLNLAFVLYDKLIVVMVVWYNQRLRPRLANLLK